MNNRLHRHLCQPRVKSSGTVLGQAGSRGGKAAEKHTISSKGYIYSEADEIRATSREGDTQKPVGAKVKHQMDPILVFLSVQTPGKAAGSWAGRLYLGLPCVSPLPLGVGKGVGHLSGSCRSSAPCRIGTFDRSGVFSLTFIQICFVLLSMPK